LIVDKPPVLWARSQQFGQACNDNKKLVNWYNNILPTKKMVFPLMIFLWKKWVSLVKMIQCWILLVISMLIISWNDRWMFTYILLLCFVD
jgi:hypothetical protein